MTFRDAFIGVCASLLFSAHSSASALRLYDREWLVPRDFNAVSWEEISAVCDPVSGACSGSLAGTDLTDWVWASSADVNELFNNYFSEFETTTGPQWQELGPGPDFVTGDTEYWTSRYAGAGFGSGFLTTYLEYNPLLGMTTFMTTRGWLRGLVPGAVGLGYYAGISWTTIYDLQGLHAIGTGYTQRSDLGFVGLGAFFVRSATVPVSGTLPLLFLTLVICLSQCRQRSR